jgi:hypothetical protein
MIASGNDQLRFRQLRRERLKRFNHKFEAFVGAPFSERQNAVRRRATTREVWNLRAPGKQTMRAKMNIVAPVLVIQDLAISGHENRDGVGEKEHPGCKGARETVKPLVLHAGIFEFHRIHQVVQSHVRVPPT